MCGRCRTVFNAFETLKRVEDELPVMPTPYFPTSAPASAVGSPVGASPYAQTMPPASSASSYHLPDSEFSAPAATTTGWAARDDSTGRFTPLLETSYVESPADALTEDQLNATATTATTATTAKAFDHADLIEPAMFIVPDLPEAEVEKFSALDDDEVATAPPTKSETGRREPTMGARDLRQLSGDAANPPLLDTTLESPLEFTADPLSGPPLIATDPSEEVEPYAELRDEEPKVSRRWVVLCGAMVIMLAALFVFYIRNSLAETYPQFRPTLASACASLGCRLSWAREYSRRAAIVRPGSLALVAADVSLQTVRVESL